MEASDIKCMFKVQGVKAQCDGDPRFFTQIAIVCLARPYLAH